MAERTIEVIIDDELRNLTKQEIKDIISGGLAQVRLGVNNERFQKIMNTNIYLEDVLKKDAVKNKDTSELDAEKKKILKQLANTTDFIDMGLLYSKLNEIDEQIKKIKEGGEEKEKGDTDLEDTDEEGEIYADETFIGEISAEAAQFDPNMTEEQAMEAYVAATGANLVTDQDLEERNERRRKRREERDRRQRARAEKEAELEALRAAAAIKEQKEKFKEKSVRETEKGKCLRVIDPSKRGTPTVMMNTPEGQLEVDLRMATDLKHNADCYLFGKEMPPGGNPFPFYQLEADAKAAITELSQKGARIDRAAILESEAGGGAAAEPPKPKPKPKPQEASGGGAAAEKPKKKKEIKKETKDERLKRQNEQRKAARKKTVKTTTKKEKYNPNKVFPAGTPLQVKIKYHREGERELQREKENQRTGKKINIKKGKKK